MTQKQIHVGIVGANAKSSWAKVSHVPALNGLPGLKLAAVATRNEQSARESFDEARVKIRSGVFANPGGNSRIYAYLGGIRRARNGF
jgi:predicted dehydrogenase